MACISFFRSFSQRLCCRIQIGAEHSTLSARMEQCFILATNYFRAVSSTSDQFCNRAAGAALDLLAERGHFTCGFILRNAFDAPHRKKQIAHADKGLVMDNCMYPTIKSIQVEAAQEYSGRTNFVEKAPTFFARRMQHQYNHSASLNTHVVCSCLIHFYDRIFAMTAAGRKL